MTTIENYQISQGRDTGMSKRMEMLFVNESGLNSISCYTTTQIAKEMGRKLIHKKVKSEKSSCSEAKNGLEEEVG